jgi:hypothetical protein
LKKKKKIQKTKTKKHRNATNHCQQHDISENVADRQRKFVVGETEQCDKWRK